MNARVLIVDDDTRLVELLARYLSPHGCRVESAADGLDGVRRAQSEVFDLIVLDVMLPGIDGFEALRRIRARTGVPVVMLTARGDEMDRVVGLDLGADDYLPKPFNPRELLARMQAVLRRAQGGAAEAQADTALEAGDLRVDSTRREVTRAGQVIHLTTTEFDLLHCFMRYPGRVLSRDALMNMLRGVGYAAYERGIDVHVKNLRHKIEPNPRQPIYVKTVWGSGYMLCATDADRAAAAASGEEQTEGEA